ncbi:MAG TPA: hypothetical protein VK813_16025, partial [Edaphobacter sp.]|nr:hypothetical protein [Edaphobacter sp.]
MRRASLFGIFLFVTSVRLCLGQNQVASSGIGPPETGIRRFELGGQVADIRTVCIGRSNCNIPSFGIGAGATLNLNAHFALDTTVNISPTSSQGSTNVDGGRIVEVLAGGQAEVRA